MKPATAIEPDNAPRLVVCAERWAKGRCGNKAWAVSGPLPEAWDATEAGPRCIQCRRLAEMLR